MSPFRLDHIFVGRNHLIFTSLLFSFLLILLTQGLFGMVSAAKCSKKELTVKPSNESHLVLSGLVTLKEHYEKECVKETAVPRAA